MDFDSFLSALRLYYKGLGQFQEICVDSDEETTKAIFVLTTGATLVELRQDGKVELHPDFQWDEWADDPFDKPVDVSKAIVGTGQDVLDTIRRAEQPGEVKILLDGLRNGASVDDTMRLNRLAEIIAARPAAERRGLERGED